MKGKGNLKMRKTALAVAVVMLVIFVCGCGKQTSGAEKEAKETVAAETTAKADETTAIKENEPDAEAPKTEENPETATIDRFVGSWGGERSGWDIEKTGEDTAKITYHGSWSAREGRDGIGTGVLKDGVLYADVEYTDYIYASGEGPECAGFVIGISKDIFTPAENMPENYECFEGEGFHVNRAVNVTPDKMEVYLKEEMTRPEEYLHVKSELINNNGKASEYMCWYSDQIIISEDEISWMNKDELRLARNEIYARHGRKFDKTDLQEFFNGRSWYNGTIDPDKFDDSVLSEVEKKNLQTFANAEKKAK